MPEKIFNSSVDNLLKRKGISLNQRSKVVKTERAKQSVLQAVEEQIKTSKVSAKNQKPKQLQGVAHERAHPLVTMYTSSDDDDSLDPNQAASNEDYGSYRPLKVDKMEVQINDKLVTEKTLMQLKTLNSLGSQISRNQRNSPKRTNDHRHVTNSYESKPNKKIENELQKINKIIQSNNKFSSVRKQLSFKKEPPMARALQTQHNVGKQITSAKIDIKLENIQNLMRQSAVTKKSGEVTTLAGASNTFMDLTSPFDQAYLRLTNRESHMHNTASLGSYQGEDESKRNRYQNSQIKSGVG